MGGFVIGEVLELWNFAGSRNNEMFKVIDVIEVDGREQVFIEKQAGWLDYKPTYYNTPERIREHVVNRTPTNKEKEG